MSIHGRLHELELAGVSVALCTVVRTRGSVPRHVGAKMLVFADGRTEGTIGGGEMESRVIRDAVAILGERTARIVRYALANPADGDPGVCGGELEVFVETIQARPTLLVVGGGHVGAALVHLARWLGFRVVVTDDRADFCTPEAIPGADEYLPIPVAELVRKYRFTPETCIVMPTRGVPVDVDALPRLLDVPHAYLGVIGSRRRWATAVERLEALGVPRAKLAGVHAPLGLELNAETPEEIAVSVLAEIVMLRRGGTGASMKWMGTMRDAGE